MRLLSSFHRDPERSLFHNVLWLLICGYFTYHLVQGDRGILAMLRLQSQLHYSEGQLVNLRHQRLDMEKHVQLLHPAHVDEDMLDEKARSTLGYAAPNEVMILLPENTGAGPAE
jgi:cell division protein FtsB